MKFLTILFASLSLSLSAQEEGPFAEELMGDDYEPFLNLRYSPHQVIEALYQAYDIDLAKAAEILESRPQKYVDEELHKHLKSLTVPSSTAQISAKPGETVNLNDAVKAPRPKADEATEIAEAGFQWEFEPSLGDTDMVADTRIELLQADLVQGSGHIHRQQILTSMVFPMGKFKLVGVTTPVIDGKLATQKRRFHLMRVQFDRSMEDYEKWQYERMKNAYKEVLEGFRRIQKTR